MKETSRENGIEEQDEREMRKEEDKTREMKVYD